MSPRPRKNSITISGLYARFDRRTDKTYYQYKNPITGKFHGLGTDKEKAEKIAVTANQRLLAAEAEHYLKQLDESPSIVKKRGISLRSWIERYIKIQADMVKNGKLSDVRFKEKKRLANLLSSRLGTNPIRDLEVRDFAILLDEFKDEDKLSAALHHRIVWVDIFKEAQHAGEVPPGWNPPEATRKPVPKVVRARLSLDDFRLMLAQAPEGHYSRNSMLLALVTGQRREDITMMKFSDIWDDHLHILQGKTGMRVALPLSLKNDAIGMTLAEVIDGCRDKFASPYLVHDRKQKKPGPLNKDNLSRRFKDIRDLVGLVPPEGKTAVVFHELRSLSERLYRAQGVDTKTLLGHKDQATTDKYNDTRGNEWVKLVI